jgi:cell division protein FtsI (penicillin-binding protein 3)
MVDRQSPWDVHHDGFNVILNIDRSIQYFTEKALEKAVTAHRAKSGMALVMSPKTGAILALALYPSFNPNNFREFDRQTWRNRAITDPFEPGSTLKVFSAAAALESGKCTSHTIFFCENGSYRIGKNVVHDTHDHGWLSLQQIVKVSSNIGAVKIAETIGPKGLYDTLINFGFGIKTGIDCPGETAGSLASYNRWTRIDTGAIAFGQGISVSAIQLITAVSAIANDGILMKPFLVQAITDQKGAILKSFRPQVVRRAVSEETARAVRQIMGTVVEKNGTGTQAALKGYKVCGKTGTAQKVSKKGGYASGKYVSSFVGFAPRDNPAAAVLVVVDEPRKAVYGGLVAAPAFKEIMLQTLNYINVAPGKPAGRLTASVQICNGNHRIDSEGS